MEELYLKTRSSWRRWLQQNHAASNGVWLVFYKKQTEKPTLNYNDAVEEALCFGWIDSLIKKRDDESYLRKMTPRKPESLWSDSNKSRIAKLSKEDLMAPAGLKKVAEAKRRGVWQQAHQRDLPLEMPAEFSAALAQCTQAKRFFESLAPSYQKQFIGWIAAAKRLPTKQRRVDESIGLLQRGEKLGMK